MTGLDKRALYDFSYGVYIVSSASGGKLNGQVINAGMQISGDPITIAVSINKQNLTHEIISTSGAFSISILADEAPMPFIGKFGFKSGRDIDKFADTDHVICDALGVPVVKQHCLAGLSAKVIGSIDVHTHTIFVGEVASAEVFSSDLRALTYSDYHLIKKGKSPKTAPTFIFNDIK